MRAFYTPHDVERLEARLTALETTIAAFLPETETAAKPAEEEDTAMIRGRCPICHAYVLSETVYTEGKGYVIRWRCARPLCNYMRVL